MRQRDGSEQPCWRGRDDPGLLVPGLPAHIPRARTLASLNRAMGCCTQCELARDRTRVVTGTGPAGAAIMFVGEAPGAHRMRPGCRS